MLASGLYPKMYVAYRIYRGPGQGLVVEATVLLN